MAADPIIYCLQELTDYDAFERLCSDVMSFLEYRDIEPLGGRSDRGRDAIFVSRANPKDITIFAYTVRSDWKKKLREDCESIQKNGHECRRLVFVCTSDLTSNDKDAAKDRVGNEYGWDLNIYDLERLRISLVGPLRHLVPKHPQIFRDPWFPKRGGISIAHGRDTIVIDHVSADHAFATWLARKLQLDGYATWCYGTAPMAGETPDDTVRALIENRAVRYLPILSKAALECPDLVGRCVLAGSHDELVVPCIVGACDTLRLGSKLQTILPIRFDSGWAGGVRELIITLEARDVIKRFDTDRGQAIALKSFVPEPVTIQQTEQLIASVFPITSVPNTVLVFQTRESLKPDQIQDARKTWAFAELASGLFASFHVPPQELDSWQMSKKRESLWRHIDQIERRYSSHVAKELLRRCLELACYNAGLAWCDDRKLLYFPTNGNPQRRIPYTNLEGKRTNVSVTGIRQYGFGERASVYHYQLAPIFRVGFDGDGNAWVTTRVYARVTEPDGTPFKGKAIGRRRKHLAKSWWNQHWLARTLALMQAIADDSGWILIGPAGRQVVASADPMTWECPVSIDEAAVERLGDFQEELASIQFIESEEGEDDVTSKDTDS